MPLSFSFNGIKKPYVTLGVGKRRTAFAPVTRHLLAIPGLAGALLDSTDTQVRVIEQPVNIEGLNREDLRKVEEDLSAWLITDKPVELVFDDEPDRTYYAIVDGSLEVEDIVYFGKGTITFVCPDPYKYGPEKIAKSNDGTITFQNHGTAETYPIVTCKIKSNTTYVSLEDGTNINMIGEVASVDDVIYVPTTTILNDPMTTTVGWGPAGFQPFDSVVTGTIVSDGQFLKPSSYGTGSAWHGPAVQKSLSEQLQNFSVEFTFQFSSRLIAELGKIQLYGLDATNKKIFMLGMSDLWNSQELNLPHGDLFNNLEQRREVLFRNQIDQFERFYGYIRITRNGRDIEFFIKMTDINGNEIATKTSRYFDSASEYQALLSGIGLHFAQFGSYTPVESIGASHITVNRINQNVGIPYIAKPGDIVVFDHKNNIITLNGEDVTKHKAFIGEYFPLKGGINTLVPGPLEVIEEVEVRWKPAWL